MKKYILLPFAAFMLTLSASAQNNTSATDVDPTLSLSKNNTTVTIGGRFAVDGAYLQSDYTPVTSGVALSDARIRTTVAVGDQWFFKADFDFSYGKFKQKDLYGRYSWNNNWIKFGYFAEPSSMNRNTSSFSTHFINRPGVVNALTQGRSLGAAYQYSNNLFFANQGIFAENPYNDQLSGAQGVALSGRWLVKPINNDNTTLHVGASLRYATINTGEFVDGVLHRDMHIGASLENKVYTSDDFLSVTLPWASSEMNLGVEALIKTPKFFARGEYIFKSVGKDRDDQRLFENQLGGMYSWSTLESWQKANPLETTNFSGGYIEAGYLLMGGGYKYDNRNSLLAGVSGNNTLELVARYGYTNLNSINEGDFYWAALDKFIPNFDGTVPDFPSPTTSIAGGAMHSFTVGLNYGINKYIKVMADYTYSTLDNVRYSLDKNFSIFQTRIQIAF